CRDAIATALDTLESVAPAAAEPGQRSDELIRQVRERADFERIVNFYRYLLTKPRLKGRALEQFRYVSRMLHRLLLEPLAAELSGKTDLIVLPDGMLGFIPFETLLDADSAYLAQRCAVRYSQSLSVLDNIAGRVWADDRLPLAAFGGAIYRPDSYAREMAAGDAQYREMRRAADPQRGTEGTAAAPWHNLPGTLVEVRMIRDAVDGSDIFTGDEVDESRIKRLSADGQLRRYRVVHFATHGQVDLARPELSAVVLSQYDPPRGGEDGYLRVPEVAGLELNADLVNLSACETGLGKIYGGEGVVGLTQAFLLAGANGLSVSLWQVADESTMRFMVALYRLVRETGMPYPAAFAAIRRQFISGEVGGGAYQNPYFWAPFVYYGQ
ncbi:MAG: CHAT domain-containing protein, partial [Candidatus Edwardsbacteria bacterium]|nr:CHAT domain-containing protein [Candidatus Edwardsbacteria bacterium]